MQLFRIASEQHISSLTGEGARLFGGRWNRKGLPAIYCSTSLALCLCEILVHTDKSIAPVDMAYITLEVADSLISKQFINFDYAKESSRKAGSLWLEQKKSLAIMVPSAVVPLSYNVILNPRHREAGKITISEPLVFGMDNRFFI